MNTIVSLAPKTALLGAVVCGVLLATGCGSKTEQSKSDQAKLKIGYLVKQPEEPYFGAELDAAQKAADEDGIELEKLPVHDGDQLMSAIDVVGTKGVQGFVVCTPDPKLGPAVVRKAQDLGMKFMTVDDQFVDSDGKIMSDIHHLGMDPHAIGKQAAQVELDEMKKRGWAMADTAICISSFRQLDTARQRLDGEREVYEAAGFTPDKMHDAPNRLTDLQSAHDAAYPVLSQNPTVKHWLISGMNDNAVLGAVRATEELHISPSDVIGVGINGTESEGELSKSQPTGYFAAMLLFPNHHGYQTTNMVYHWVKDNTEPPKLTLIPEATIMTRDNYKQALIDHGLKK